MPRTNLRSAFALLGVFALYVAGGKLGLALATVHQSATAVWPPTGIAIAAGLVFGVRVWPAILAGAFAVNVTTSGDVVSSLGIALGNTLEAVVAVRLTERLANGRYAFLHVATVLRFALIALVATPVSATIGTSILLLAGLAPPMDAGSIWFTWWIGDLAGALVVAPLLVLWTMRIPRQRDDGEPSELIALSAAVAAITLIVFAPISPLARANYPIGFLVFPVLVWPVVRFGPRIAATTAAAISIVAVWGTVQGAGPWVRGTANESLLLAQTFMGVATLTSLVVAAAVLERQQALESLRATEERLRRAEEGKVAARDQFLSIAAHELRTPLTSIQLAAQYLLHEMDAGRALNSDRVRAATATLASQTERFGALISQLLDTVRVQMSRMDLSISDQDVAEIARRAAHEMQAITTRHEIRVDADGPVRAAIDPIRIEQVLRNLLDNAVKFSPGGEIVVGVGSDDEHVIVDVRDHGPGIPPEARERIFDRFYQARPDSRDRGLGLGLHVSRHIVELHGGTIAAEFPADGGTRIVVRLPARVAAAPELEEALR